MNNHIIDELINIKIPDGFGLMEEKHPLHKQLAIKPQTMYIHLDNTFIVAEAKQADGKVLVDELKRLYALIGRITPGFSGIGAARKVVNGIEMGVMQYKSNGVNSDLYNSILLCHMKGYQILISIHAAWKNAAKWRTEFFKMIETIEEKVISE